MCDTRNQRSPPRLLCTENWEEGELEGREQGNWGEIANLVIMSGAAAAAAAAVAANSTGLGKVETEQHEITGVMKTPGSVPHRDAHRHTGKTWEEIKKEMEGFLEGEGAEKVCWHALGPPIMIRAPS